ncbi:hypothetical protein A1OE_1084 [Candidatus Endolissoclinum faulkneri L2]|uniref:Uncharacterized protein n=1 Tax=Candidatus Endolissoclinum faulkneri L2 TaxID=1193729 RepID=K7YNZ7_9PROT|nr:hypothetical protein A1OE_1084 [Candidatus Endolissoclinum faulkneri L2]
MRFFVLKHFIGDNILHTVPSVQFKHIYDNYVFMVAKFKNYK